MARRSAARRWWLKRGRKLWRRVLRKVRAAPPVARAAVIAALGAGVLLTANIVYQVARKPTEMLWLLPSGKKAPAETWRQYAAVFREYSTENVTPELLAALAQIESAGDPAARTYWRWHLTWHPFGIFAPASSSVGMYQMTDAAFAEARRYCIRDHSVVKEGCWGFYIRLFPAHAAELAAIFLDRHLSAILAVRPDDAPTAEQKQDLAAVLYLCGPGPASSYAHHRFQLTSGERCGDKEVAGYLAQVKAMRQQFHRLAVAQ